MLGVRFPICLSLGLRFATTRQFSSVISQNARVESLLGVVMLGVSSMALMGV